MASETQKLKKKLDRLFSEWVRRSGCVDGFCVCYTCGNSKPYELTDAGHYVSRQHSATRWLPMNCKPQCRGCNRFNHGRPIDFREHLVAEYGELAVVELEQQRHETRQWTDDELDAAIDVYQAKLAGMR
jgi:hypothetical protein